MTVAPLSGRRLRMATAPLSGRRLRMTAGPLSGRRHRMTVAPLNGEGSVRRGERERQRPGGTSLELCLSGMPSSGRLQRALESIEGSGSQE